ncbi:ABC transporter permease [Corynebacterium sp.]|uniref:ABC transporter permease n=1 Tax=Corynebacterium sp. TaxID=1720 RepID=UPI0026DD4519|nr:ABC transporter permease [Corynebacterium sp.]MDO5033116.1 ABC transporter permease [Corynebacterium sp.]
MNFAESLRMALGSLRTNKMRSALTLLGVIIGIAAVVAIMTLGRSLQTSVQSDLDRVGVNNFSVEVKDRPEEGEEDKPEDPYAGAASVEDVGSMISPEMLDRLKEALGDEVSGVLIGEYSSYSGTLRAESGTGAGGSAEVNVQPTNPDYVNSPMYSIVAGRALSDDDIDSQRAVVMLSTKSAEELFGSAQEAVGQYLTVEAENSFFDLAVIGVYEEAKTGPLVGTAPFEYAFVPYPFEAELSEEPGAGEAFTSVSVRGNPDMDKTVVARDLQSFFDSYYADDPDYMAKVSDFSEDLASLTQMFTTISLVLAAIGGISLLVGGIGVMNIMLITVTERTREIGIRKALGARRRDIRTQFITEAVIVCLLGGLLGVAIGATVGMIGAAALGTFVLPPLGAVFLSLLFSLAIGLFFGYYPAGKAAKLDPIEALRYE